MTSSRLLELLGFERKQRNGSRYPLAANTFYHHRDAEDTVAYDETGVVWTMQRRINLSLVGFTNTSKAGVAPYGTLPEGPLFIGSSVDFAAPFPDD